MRVKLLKRLRKESQRMTRIVDMGNGRFDVYVGRFVMWRDLSWKDAVKKYTWCVRAYMYEEVEKLRMRAIEEGERDVEYSIW